MNYFVDFDNTLYNTPILAKDMLEELSKYISSSCNISYEDVFTTVSNKFGRGENKIFDIYDLISFFAKNQYYCNEKEATEVINKVISNGEKNLFKDSVPFLQYLQKKGHKTYIISYHESRVHFQTVKIAGSGILKYVNGTITTTTLKGDMPFNFAKCVFIDDNPKDLASIYENNPYQVYRIRRENNKYSKLETNLQIPEFSSLEEFIKKNNV